MIQSSWNPFDMEAAALLILFGRHLMQGCDVCLTLSDEPPTEDLEVQAVVSQLIIHLRESTP